MNNIFIRKFWEEENIVFYLHFQNGIAVRQIEFKDQGTVYLTEDNPVIGDSMLNDQPIDKLDFDERNLITEAEFNNLWNTRS